MEFTNKKGFSLVELMITVSLIGILAAIGIPSYSKFRIKAYQTEAKTQLANLYVAQKSFYIQYNSYYPSLSMIGYAPAGNTRYNVGFGAYDLTVTTEPAIAPWQLMTSKLVCTGVGGVGADSRCNMMVATPNIDAGAIVRQHSYVAAAASYESMLAKNKDAASSLIQVAEMLVLGIESHAVAVNIVNDPCSNRDDLWIDYWGIDQNKVISTKKFAPNSGYIRTAAGTLDGCYQHTDPQPADPNALGGAN